MLKQASVSQYKREQFPRETSHLVITMRHYPRFIRKELRDEFLCVLAPVKELLKEFNEAQKRLGHHDGAFAATSYEQRFFLSKKAMAELKRLSELSKKKDVYLACVCRVGEMCHREMLMLLSEKLFATTIGAVYNRYPTFMRRVEAGEFHCEELLAKAGTGSSETANGEPCLARSSAQS